MESIRRQCALKLQRKLEDPRLRAEKAEELPVSVLTGAANRATSTPCLSRRHPAVPPLPLHAVRSSSTPSPQSSCEAFASGVARKASSHSSSAPHRLRPATVPSAPVFATAVRSRSTPGFATGQRASRQAAGGHAGNFGGRDTSAGRFIPPDQRLGQSGGMVERAGRSGSSLSTAPAVVRRRSPVKRENPERIRPTHAPKGGVLAPTVSSLRRGSSGMGSRTSFKNIASIGPVRGSTTTKRPLSPDLRQRSVAPTQRTEGVVPISFGGIDVVVGDPVARSLSPSFRRAIAEHAGRVSVTAPEEPSPLKVPRVPEEPRKISDAITNRNSHSMTHGTGGFNSSVDNLQEAASALRRIIPAQLGAIPITGSFIPAQLGETPVTSSFVPAQLGADPGASSFQFSPSARPSSSAGAVPDFQLSPIRNSVETIGERSFAPDVHDDAMQVQRLLKENATLREAFNEATERLSRLEDEKARFMDEGVYDFVNSVCGNPAAQPGMLPWRTEALIVPQPSSPLTPASEPRHGDELRSCELSAENEELRRELARASEVGEALEHTQQAAEDRIHVLEQEQALLAQHLARCRVDDTHVNHGSPVAAGCTGGSEAIADAIARRSAASVAPRAEDDTAALVRHLAAIIENGTNDPTHRLLLEQLRTSEERQAELLEENARLQALRALAEASSLQDAKAPIGIEHGNEQKENVQEQRYDESTVVSCSCGNVFMPDAVYCRKCGKPRQRREVIICDCGQEVPRNAKFCDECGRNLQASVYLHPLDIPESF